MKKIFIIPVLVILIIACKNTTESKYGKIEPLKSSTYFSDDSITFRAESSENDIEWKSSLDGSLGKGSLIIQKLSVGNHKVQLISGNDILDSVDILIKSVEYVTGESKKITLFNDKNYIELPAGKYSPYIYSTSDHTMTSGIVSRGLNGVDNSNKVLNLKSYNYKSKSITVINRSIINKRSRAITDTVIEKKFVVADTTSTIEEGIVINADLLYSGSSLNLWLDKNSKKNSVLLEQLWKELNEIVLPRVLKIWGEWSDIDNNNAVNILVTPKINEQGRAIGFFNPSDFHPYNNDKNSRNYNVVTNEMDIVYIGDPSYDEASFAYSKNSLLATLAHEITHLINYSNKVYIPMKNGSKTYKKEELFLDEGLAHLTESLCGYGVSGGNIAFFAKYLEDPGYYSLKYANGGGVEDSVGRRGFVSAFLSWLFWESGGAEWSSENPGLIIDKGGVTFLRKMLNSDLTGWDNLKYSLGDNIDTYFVKWVEEINKVASGYSERSPLVVDPVTNEVISISPFNGDVIINNKTYSLNGPVKVDFDLNSIILPYSYTFLKNMDIEAMKTIEVDGEVNKGLVVASFSMY